MDPIEIGSSDAFPGAGVHHAVDVEARASRTTTAFTRLDLHLDAVGCTLTGTVIEPPA